MSYGYVVPRLDTDAFNCPNCGAYAQQRQSYTADDLGTTIRGVRVTWCARCENFALWREGGMICPAGSAVPMPEPDMPDDVQSDYLEARDIANRSPRGGAALLRLAMQKLMVALGEGGKDLNKDIGSLVKKGLPLKIQQALDAVRVIGNNAVHPGELDLRDDIATANALFDLLNMIVSVMITQPKQVEAVYEKIPAGAREQIERRDTPTS